MKHTAQNEDKRTITGLLEGGYGGSIGVADLFCLIGAFFSQVLQILLTVLLQLFCVDVNDFYVFIPPFSPLKRCQLKPERNLFTVQASRFGRIRYKIENRMNN